MNKYLSITSIVLLLGIFAQMAYPSDIALGVITTMILLKSVLWYYITTQLYLGLYKSKINTEFDTLQLWTERAISAVGVIVLLFSGDFYVLVGVLSLPWIKITLAADAISTMCKYDILDVSYKDENDE